MTPQPAPPGVSYEAYSNTAHGYYHIRLHGQHIGNVTADRPRKPRNWTATDFWGRTYHTAGTRNQAAALLLAWLEEQP